MKAVVVSGSSNGERNYGLTSGDRVAKALSRRGWYVEIVDGGDLRQTLDALISGQFELAVPVGFGPLSAEDGTIWTLAHAAGVPCSGPAPTAGTICTDKSLFSHFINGLFADDPKVKTPRQIKVAVGMDSDAAKQLISNGDLSIPLIVKPVLGGSSEGLSVARSTDEAAEKATVLSQSLGPMLVQEYIGNAREFTVTTVDEASGTRVLPIIELNHNGVLVMGVEEKFGDEAHQRHVINPEIDSVVRQHLYQIALRIHEAAGARGIQRIDVLINADGVVFVLEANPVAGLLAESLAVDAAVAAGLTFEDLAERYALTAFLPPICGPVSDVYNNAVVPS